MDSWEKIERRFEGLYDARKRYMTREESAAFLSALNHLRALRERDEKRWEIVGKVEAEIDSACHAFGGTYTPGGNSMIVGLPDPKPTHKKAKVKHA